MTTLLTLLMQSDTPNPAAAGAVAAMGTGMSIVILVVSLLLIVSMWKVFTKAGEPGWAAIIPIYNLIVLLKIAGKPAWWFILFLIPLVNFIVAIIVCIALARNFGKGTGFGLGLAFLGFIFFPILGFGDARYQPVPQT